VPTNLPEKRNILVDRATLERVIARATELQGNAADGDETLSEDQLIEIGKEVGLSAGAVGQALAEERTRVFIPDSGGFVTHVAGPAVATATRIVTGTPEEILFALDDWMRREECLQVQRRFRDRIVWEPRGGVVGTIRRVLNVNGRGFHLCRAANVAATVVAREDKKVSVRLDADLSESRSIRLKAGGATATAGAIGSFAVFGVATLAHVAVLLSAGLAVVPLALCGVGAYELARRHRTVFARVQLALEQSLDRVEHGSLRRLK
jgi:hypothetical protein